MQNKLYPRLVASSAMFGSIMPCANVRKIVVVRSSEPLAMSHAVVAFTPITHVQVLAGSVYHMRMRDYSE